MIKAVIFDMDGTICDTIEDLATATNYAMQELGFPAHTIDEYKYMVGNGIPNLIYKALPEDKKDMKEKAREIMLSYYKDHFADKTYPYDGIIPMLTTLKEQGFRLAVCTNKAHHMALVVAEKFFDRFFEIVYGQREGHPLKPDPAQALEILDTFGLTPAETLFVGDSGVDMQTAKNLGAVAVGVEWGFRTADELKENGADYIVSAPQDILEIIKGI